MRTGGRVGVCGLESSPSERRQPNRAASGLGPVTTFAADDTNANLEH